MKFVNELLNVFELCIEIAIETEMSAWVERWAHRAGKQKTHFASFRCRNILCKNKKWKFKFEH